MDLAQDKRATRTPPNLAGLLPSGCSLTDNRGPFILAEASTSYAWSTESEACIRIDERRRLARELHDSTSQLLVLLELQIMRLKQLACVPKSRVFDDVLAELSRTIATLHEEVRAVGRPEESPLELGQSLTAMIADFASRTGVAVRSDIDELPAEAPPEIAHTLYRVAQEALANVSRHAQARNVSVSLSTQTDSVALRVADDGRGFQRALPRESRGLGIENMRARLDELGGNLTLENGAPGAVITATIGLQSPA